MTRSALKVVSSTQNAERAVLAEAVAQRTAAAAALAQAEAELEVFEVRLDGTVSAFYRADDALSQAKSSFESELTTYGGDEVCVTKMRLNQGRVPPREQIASAEHAYVEAKQRYDLGKAGHVTERAKLQVAQDAFVAADRDARQAADEVLRIGLFDMVDKAEALHRDLLARRSVIEMLGSGMNGVTYNTDSRTEFGQRIATLINDIPIRHHREDIRREATAPWRAAKEALVVDASAPIPENIR